MKKYIVVEAGWDIEENPFVWVDGPFNKYYKEYQRRKCNKVDKHDDYDTGAEKG